MLCLVYLLPTAGIQDHVRQSLNLLLEEGESPVLLEGFKGSTLDNYTDALMLANACYESENSFYKAAMLVERKSNNEGQPLESLAGYLLEDTGEIRVYSRYWHGYLVFLKPLLMILNYEQIRVINSLIFLMTFLTAVIGFCRQKMWRGLVAFLLAFISLFPVAIPCSLQFSATFYIGTGACIYILWKYNRLNYHKSFFQFFLVTGILTSFMDYLTYPLFTFGMPLVILVVLERSSGWGKFMRVVEAGFYWGFGYLGMWLGKWSLGSILTGSNLFRDAMGAVVTRLSHEAYGEKISTMVTILRNGYIFFNIIGICIMLFLVCWVVFAVRKFKKYIAESSASILIVIAFLPIGWYIVATNHSYVHYWFTFRNFAISVFALGMIPESLYRESV